MNSAEIRGLIKQLGITQAKFADWLGVPVSCVHDWVQGLHSPNKAAVRLLELAKAGKLGKPGKKQK